MNGVKKVGVSRETKSNYYTIVEAVSIPARSDGTADIIDLKVYRRGAQSDLYVNEQKVASFLSLTKSIKNQFGVKVAGGDDSDCIGEIHYLEAFNSQPAADEAAIADSTTDSESENRRMTLCWRP